MTVNERMFAIMDQKGIRDIELAKCLNKNTSSISTWKTKGTNPPIEYAVRIAELLDVSVHYLLTGEEDSEIPQDAKKLLSAFQTADPATQQIVKKILDIPEERASLTSTAGRKIG